MHGGGSTDTGYIATNVHSSKDFESYKIFELRAKYFISKRVEVNAFIPVLNNKTETNNVYNTITGLGDITLSGGYHLILPKEENNIKQKLIMGIGIKLPTGFCNYLGNDNLRLPFEMQPSTGSTDALIYVNYIIMNSHFGMSTNMSYKINGQNKFHERVSNSTTDFLSLFYKIKIKKIAIYPSVLTSYEYTKGIVTNNRLDKATELNCLMIGPGLDIYYKSFSINTAWQFTTAEKVNDGTLKSVGRISVGINYSFNKIEKKKVI